MTEPTATSTVPPEEPRAQAPAPRATGFPWFAYSLLLLLSICVTLAGLGLMFWWSDQADLGVVQKVRLTAKPDLDLKKIQEVLDTPDYYVEIVSEQGSIRTDEMKDTPIGSGLTFTPPVPMRLIDIKEVRVFDAETVGKDKLVDRADKPLRETKGEKFVFSFQGEEPPK